MPFKLVALTYCIFVALIMAYLSKGDYTGVGSDFSFYFDRLVFIKEYSPPFLDWFSTSLGNYPDSPTLKRLSDWVPTPFYSLGFLGPFLLHQSEILFAAQGVVIAWISILNIRHLAQKFYGFCGPHAVNAMVLLAAINPAFLKDSLTCGPTSVCNLFILLAFRLWNHPLISAVLFACAAMTRSSYFLYIIAIYLACLLVSRRKSIEVLSRTAPSIIVFAIFYYFFYSSYPGSGFAYIFVIGLHGMGPMEDFMVQVLSPHYPVQSAGDIAHLNISFFDLIKLAIADLKVAYSMFVIWIFKVIAFLGFPHLLLIWDMRSLWIQRLAALIYFIVVMAPGFVIASFASIFAWRSKRLWVGDDKVVVVAALLFTLLHSLIMGTSRYAIITSWVYSAFLVRFIVWFASVV